MANKSRLIERTRVKRSVYDILGKSKVDVEEGVEELKTGEDEIEATTDKEKADCRFRPWRPFEVKFIVFSVQTI